MTKEWYADLPKFYQRQIKAAGFDSVSMNRRALLKGAAIAGGTAAMAGFMSGPASADEATQITYMCWEGYNDPKIVEPFEKANNAKLNIDLIVDSPSGFAKLAAGASREVDIISSDSPWIARLGPAGLCEYLDDAEFADIYSSFYPQFKAPFEPLSFEGKATGLPSRWGWIGPCINTDYSKPDDWRDFSGIFEEKNKNKIGLLDWGDWPIMPIVLHIGIDPYKPMGKPELEEFRVALRKVFKNSRVVIGDLSVAQKGLLDGSLSTLVGTGSYATSGLRKQGHLNITSTVPEPAADGFKRGIIWLEGTAVIKGTKNLDLAKKMVKHIATPEVGAVLSWTDTTCNPTPNAKVETTYTDEQKTVLQTDYMWQAWDKSRFHNIAPNIDDMLQIWQEELAA